MATGVGRLGAGLLIGLVLVGCGEKSPDQSAEPTGKTTGDAAGCTRYPTPSQTPEYDPESGYAPDAGDMPPNYEANHAFQRRANLCGEDLVEGEAAAERVRTALEELPKADRGDGDAILRTLSPMGYGEYRTTLTPMGDAVAFVIDINPVCLDGTSGPNGVEVEASGMYAEGTGCVKPVGGH